MRSTRPVCIECGRQFTSIYGVPVDRDPDPMNTIGSNPAYDYAMIFFSIHALAHGKTLHECFRSPLD